MTSTPAPRTGRDGGTGRRRLGRDERRAEILRATIAVVARHGLDGASASLIAAEAGMSKGLIWHYFTDKNDLMKQAVAACVQGIGTEIASVVDYASAPVPDVVRATLRWLAAARRTRAAEFAAMDEIGRNLRTPDGRRAFSTDDYEAVHRAQEKLFRRGQEEGDLRPFDTRVMAVLYQGAIDTMLAYLADHPDLDTDRYADAFTDLLLAAMTTAPATPAP
jgi:AcrR family transcriptional regulator